MTDAGQPSQDRSCDRTHEVTLSAEAALQEELTEVARRRDQDPMARPAESGKPPQERAASLKLTALCLSGGGMRSAAYCLGAVQALARKGILLDFDYLSTVSAGGFIGAWLHTALSRDQNTAEAQRRIGRPDAPEAQRLRAFRAVLAPRFGVLSDDVWTWIAVHLRNTGLNLFFFLQIFMLAALLPILLRTTLAWVGDSRAAALVCLVAGTGCLGWSVYFGFLRLPSYRKAAKNLPLSSLHSPWLIVAPLLVWAFTMPTPFMYVTGQHEDCPAHYRVVDVGHVPVCTLRGTAGDAQPFVPPIRGPVFRFSPLLPLTGWMYPHFGAPEESAAARVRTRELLMIARQLPIPALYLLALALGYCAAWFRFQRTRERLAFRANLFSWCFASALAAIFLFIILIMLAPSGPLYPLYGHGSCPIEFQLTDMTHIVTQRPGISPRSLDVRTEIRASIVGQAGVATPGASTFDREVGGSLSSYPDSDRYFPDTRPSCGWLVNRASMVVVLLPLLLILGHLFQTSVYLAMRRRARAPDLDRIWIARTSGQVLQLAFTWTVIAACAVLGPSDLRLVGQTAGTTDHLAPWSEQGLAALAGAGTALTALSAYIAKQMETELEVSIQAQRPVKSWILSILAATSAVALLLAAGAYDGHALGWFQQLVWPDSVRPPLATHILPKVSAVTLLPDVGLATLLVTILWLGNSLNLGRFSLHSVYRMRLSRVFLGAPRDTTLHRPEPDSGFAEHDTIPLAALRDRPTGYRLYPVFNITMNRMPSLRAGGTIRAMESFVASPMFCGALGPTRSWGWPQEATYPQQHDTAGGQAPPAGVVARTRYFAGMDSRGDRKGEDTGVRVGTVATLSGAAASSSWGYHSSEALLFLMTLFNMRLGSWLPNPTFAHSRAGASSSCDRTLVARTLARPAPSIVPWLPDFGIPWLSLGEPPRAIYLSDGGHFDSTGLYEMLRRRCHRILAVDAGADPDTKFAALGEAIRKAQADHDVQILVEAPGGLREKFARDGFVRAKIVYPGGVTGELIYVRPVLLPGAPAGISAQPKDGKDFPHETTPDHRFTESQFESYRALGDWQLSTLLANARTDTIPAVFEAGR